MRRRREFCYNGSVGHWWLKKSLDSCHVRAYRKVADFIRNSFVREPRRIVDYACGSGALLALLSRRFPKSNLTGLDGSAFLLASARRRFARLPAQCAERISLIETPLPNCGILKGKADLVIFCFPNMDFSFSGNSTDVPRECLTQHELRIARRLVASDAHEQDGLELRHESFPSAIEQGRCISRNLRQLLSAGGICVRIEYATMQRHELTASELALVSFEEGSLDARIDGLRPRLWFRVLASAFYRSRVLEDVYEQTGDERDRNGGYLITVLRAV